MVSFKSSRARLLDPVRPVLTGILLALSLGCASPGPAQHSPIANWSSLVAPDAAAVFDDREAAVMGAFRAAAASHTPKSNGRLRVGTIRQVEGGFSFSPPKDSSLTVWAGRPPIVRLRLTSRDVATYVVQPGSGDPRVDRASEKPSRGLRRIVDELDAAGRPIYLLTPSKRVVRYEGGSAEAIGSQRVVEALALERCACD